MFTYTETQPRDSRFGGNRLEVARLHTDCTGRLNLGGMLLSPSLGQKDGSVLDGALAWFCGSPGLQVLTAVACVPSQASLNLHYLNQILNVKKQSVLSHASPVHWRTVSLGVVS
uniref:Uncharacterized protein n=1 Tax=Urocitellus parryii TaxID=9999 RepID=A0A8D2GST8_UROPR